MPHHNKGGSVNVGRALRGGMVAEHGYGRDQENLDPLQSYCCVPTMCPFFKQDPINVGDPGDAVKVLCNNEACTQGTWMHAACFEEWEQHVLNFLRSCGRARSWSEKQRIQNLWTKKGYDLAFKACDCKCGRGHLRKDLNYIPEVKPVDVKPKKHKKKQPERILPNSVPVSKGYGGSGMGHNQVQNHGSNPHTSLGVGMSAGKPQLRVRTSSFSSTGSSPPSSAGTPPLTPGGSKTKFDFFADDNQAAAGNIFRRRTDFNVFNVLPRHRQNPYHIKMEDEGPHGNDETRCFVLTNLSTQQVTSVSCVACNIELPIFDKYPLIDGTFFLSPLRYNSDLQVLFDHKMCFLNAVCMRCLTGTGRSLRCRACRTTWQGSMLVIGTMYSYDIFAAMPCCAQRLSCKNCRRPILDPGCAFQFFSEYSKVIQCPHCKCEDHHFIKAIHDSYVLKQSICLH